MAAKYIYQNGFLLLLFNFISTAALEKRFSDLKRCADEECSMLLVRGKALDDFRGPDCRFLSFKKSETIYVYYKLAGRRADMWAGSVGSNFGYFPKDLLAINHIYTEKEFEVPAQETDFVCFETGFDKFQSYDVDHLLGFLKESSKDPSNVTSSLVPESVQKQKPFEEDVPQDNPEVPDEKNNSLHERDLEAVLKSNETPVTSDTKVVGAVSEQLTLQDSATENITLEVNETKEESFQPEEERFPPEETNEPEPQVSTNSVQIPDLKTSYGDTFDAVVTEVIGTDKTTPPETETQGEDTTETLLLTEDTTETLLLTEDDSNAADSSRKRDKSEDSMWSALGDAVFSVVTGGEKPTHAGDVGSDEVDDDEDDDEDVVPPPPKTFDEIRADKQPIDVRAAPPAEIVSKRGDEEETQTESLNDVGDPKKSSDAEELLFEEEVVDPDEGQTQPVQTQNGVDLHIVESVQQYEASQTQEYKDIPGQRSQMHDSTSVDEVQLVGKSNVNHTMEKIQDDIFIVTEVEHLDEHATKLEVEVDSNLPVEGVDLQNEDVVKYDPESIPEETAEEKQENMDTSIESNIGRETDTYSLDEPSHENVEVIEPDLKETEELLEDENALYLSQTYSVNSDQSVESPSVPQISTPEPKDGEDDPLTLTDEPSDTHSPNTAPPEPLPEHDPEPIYSDDVMRLSILREHLSEDKMARCQKFLGLKNLFKLEAMFEDLQTELQATRQSQVSSIHEIEDSLERILETSENAILDEVEKVLDGRDSKRSDAVGSNIDEETEILDDFQELAFSLRHKFSTASDSAPLAVTADGPVDLELDVNENPVVDEEEVSENSTEDERYLTASHPELPADSEKTQGIILDQVHAAAPDVSVEEDTGHFNRNKDNQQDFGSGDEMTKVPQATLESPLDMGLGVEVDNSPSGSLESIESPSEFHEDEVGVFSSGLVYLECIAAMVSNKTTEWATGMISLLPDEWRPGETVMGCPWQAVVVTALVGIVTFTLFFWGTVLAVKKREYLVDHKMLNQQIESLKKQKDEALVKITELQTQTELLKENQKESAETATTALRKMQTLETKVTKAETQNEEMAQEKDRYIQLLEEERMSSQRNGTRIEKLEKSNEKLQQSRKKAQETLAKTTLLLDEARIREDARNVQQKNLEKDYTSLKEENKSLKTTMKSWEDKHKELSEQIKVYQKSQKELEDALALKDHNIEVLSDLMSDLDACDLQKGDAKVSNGELSDDKTTAIKNRIRQMMDVSRVQTTLTVVEEERDRFMSKLLAEEKMRKELEEQHQELEHAIATLKSEKSHVENQHKILQQKNEIIVEMYQQKESALQQRLTKEEMERRSKESMLTEVGGKATEAEEQVKLLRQRINEMEEQMKKTEEMYKEQIKEQENKTHSNWINARNAERALNQEKLEASKLREKLTVLTSQLNEKRAPLFRPNSGQFPGARQGDSYGPSPVSGGAPSPPIMIEGPRRPPSAPVGRKIDPFGPRPPSDPHGRYAENKHVSGMEMGPRNSSPANMDAPPPQGPAEGQASSASPEPGLGSFIASPIRDSPGSAVPGPPPGPGPHEPLLPPGPPGRIPPPGVYRPMRPGPYPYPPPGPGLPPHGPPLQANGHPGIPMGDFGPRPSNGHAFQPRPGPGPIDPRSLPPPHFRPLPPNFGPMPPPHVLRGPMGPLPPDMRYPGPRASPPTDLPPGVPPQGPLPHGFPPQGPLPHGIPPQGPLPHGIPPQGPLPHGIPPQGPLPHGIPPQGPLPHGIPPQGPLHHRVPPPGPLPHGIPPPGPPSHSGPYDQPSPQSFQNSGAQGNPGPDSPQGAGSPAGIEP